MRWTYSIQNKMAAAALLGVVLVVMIGNNLAERSNSKKLQKDFISMYEDRLVVESYILQLSEHLHRVIHLIDQSQGQEPLTAADAKLWQEQIDELTCLYGATHLTMEEEAEFGRLKETLAEIAHCAVRQDWGKCKNTAEAALHSLTALSDIQVAEGASIKNRSVKIFNTGIFTSQFEMAVLIVVALLILALIFSSRSLRTLTREQHHHMN